MHMSVSMFVREKKIDCGCYREVDIIPRTDNAEKAVKGKRGKRVKITAPKQMNLNQKNSKRYLVQIANGNFGIGDYHISATYSEHNLPSSIEEAEKCITNWLRKVAYRRNKLGLEPMKYILVTEYKYAKDGTSLKRIHHHIIMNGGLQREELELMWTKKRINWKKINDWEYINSIEQIGYINADRIQFAKGENGLEALCHYITKDPQVKKGKKTWSSSRNLVRPVQQPNADSKYTKSKLVRLATSPDQGKEFFQKQFKNYEIDDIRIEYYEDTGWHIYIKMWRKKPIKRRLKCKKKRSRQKN